MIRLRLLLLLLFPLVRSDWTSVCPPHEAGVELYLDAKVVRVLTEKEQEVMVVESKEREVRVRCHNPRGAAELHDHRGHLLADKVTESLSNSLQYTLWARNYTGLWRSEKTVSCSKSCQLKLIEVKEGAAYQSRCHLDSVRGQTNLWCNVSGWLHQAFTNPGEFECDSSDYDFRIPNYEFFFWSQESEQWRSCSKHDMRRAETGRDRNVTFIRCGLSDSDPAQDLLVKMVKSHPSQSPTGLPFLEENQCSEAAYFLVLQPGEEEPGWYRQITLTMAGALLLTLTAGLLAGVCRRRRRRKTEDKTAGTRCSLIMEAEMKSDWLDLTDQQKVEMMQCAVLDGDDSRLNPSLPRLAQPRQLHYDRRFERRRDSFQMGYLLGQGQYGAVYVGTADNIYGPETTKVAVKQAKHGSDQNQFYAIIDELKILSNLAMHPNLVNLLGACTSNSHLNEVYLLLEFCPFGDLKKFLLEHRERFQASLQNQPGHLESPFNSSLLLTWSYSIARALDYLSSLQIMHGDLAARNILIGENYVAKISDFGLSKMMYYNEDYKKTERKLIPWAWMATEYLQTGEFNIKSDVWSYGVTLWEIFSLGNKPYGIEPYEEIKQKILAGERLCCPESLHHLAGGERLYTEVMLPCWATQPTTRPAFASLAASLESMLGEEGRRRYEEMARSYMERLPLIQRSGQDTPPPPYSQAEEYIPMERTDGGSSRPRGYIALEDLNNK